MDTDLVFDFWGDVAESVWDEYEDVINGMRKDSERNIRLSIGNFLLKKLRKELLQDFMRNTTTNYNDT